jgi:hypothetical protein
MGIKRRKFDIRIWKKKYLFLGISTTNIETLVPLLSQWVENRIIGVLELLSRLPRRQQNVCHQL